VTLPAIAAPGVGEKIYVVAQCAPADGPYLGESFGKNSLIVYPTAATPGSGFTLGEHQADYQDTVTHEIGHAFNQTPLPGAQPDAPNIPDHPTQADRGQGNHCQVTTPAGKFKCVMYDSGPMKDGIHKYCETCHPYLLAQDLTKFR